MFNRTDLSLKNARWVKIIIKKNAFWKMYSQLENLDKK